MSHFVALGEIEMKEMSKEEEREREEVEEMTKKCLRMCHHRLR